MARTVERTLETALLARVEEAVGRGMARQEADFALLPREAAALPAPRVGTATVRMPREAWVKLDFIGVLLSGKSRASRTTVPL
ncbi:MAG: hypothetical protein ACYC5S_01520 [Thiobacillus sp.]